MTRDGAGGDAWWDAEMAGGRLSLWLKRVGADFVVSIILLILVAVVWSYVIQAGIRSRRLTDTVVRLQMARINTSADRARMQHLFRQWRVLHGMSDSPHHPVL